MEVFAFRVTKERVYGEVIVGRILAGNRGRTIHRLAIDNPPKGVGVYRNGVRVAGITLFMKTALQAR
jgi:hypothetical protein